MITVQCCICGSDIQKYPSKVQKNNYCSVECRDGKAEKYRAEITELLKENTVIQVSEKLGIPENTIMCWLGKWRKKGIDVKCAMQYAGRYAPKKETVAEKMERVRAAKAPAAKQLPTIKRKPKPRHKSSNDSLPNLLRLKGSDKVFIHDRDKGKVYYKINHRSHKMCYPHELPAMRALYPEFNPQIQAQ